MYQKCYNAFVGSGIAELLPEAVNMDKKGNIASDNDDNKCGRKTRYRLTNPN